MTQAGSFSARRRTCRPSRPGEAVDRRADIWAFGCVLYEMLTGRQAFPGDSIAELLAGVIERDPDWIQLPATLPVRVRDLLRRCLEKDPRKRRRDIGDVRIEIEQALSEPAQMAAAVVYPTSSRSARLA